MSCSEDGARCLWQPLLQNGAPVCGKLVCYHAARLDAFVVGRVALKTVVALPGSASAFSAALASVSDPLFRPFFILKRALDDAMPMEASPAEGNFSGRKTDPLG